MYAVSPHPGPLRRKPRRRTLGCGTNPDCGCRKTLGQVTSYTTAAQSASDMLTPPWWTWFFPPAAGVYELTQVPNFIPPLPANANAGQQIALNAATGALTSAQVQDIQQQMHAANKVASNGNTALEAAANAQGDADLAAYIKSIGGTSEQQLASAVTLGIPWWGWALLAAPVAYVVWEKVK